jgi:hypothetical protein
VLHDAEAGHLQVLLQVGKCPAVALEQAVEEMPARRIRESPEHRVVIFFDSAHEATIGDYLVTCQSTEL